MKKMQYYGELKLTAICCPKILLFQLRSFWNTESWLLIVMIKTNQSSPYNTSLYSRQILSYLELLIQQVYGFEFDQTVTLILYNQLEQL